jgi:putative chromate ion transporter
VKTRYGLILFALCACTLTAVGQSPVMSITGDTTPPDEPLSLWYQKPASDHPPVTDTSAAALAASTAEWVQALPIANGHLGAMVFGGGHVVLPLLERATVGRGWLDHDTFLAGYGAAQALPGPLFTFAAYLGATISVGPHGIIGGLLALLAIYLPSALLIFGVLPRWERLRQMPLAQALLAGTNAAVVGLLGAAFYSPICTSAMTEPKRWVIAVVIFIGLMFGKMPPWLAVLACALAGKLFLH